MGKILALGLILTCLSTAFVVGQSSNPMVRIAGGSFQVFDKTGKLRNSIEVNSFEMAKYPVTNAEWEPFKQEFSKSIGGQSAGNAFYLSEISPDLNMPTFGMTWYAAVAYCNWRSKKEGLTPVYEIHGDWAKNKAFRTPPTVKANWAANGYRLPTLAEWMFVFTERGQKETRYPGSDDLGEVGYFLTQNSPTIILAPVGTKKPSAQGIYDLVGEVPQWCWDFFEKDYLYTAKPDNPHGPSEVPFDKTIFDAVPDKAGGNPDTGYYKTAHVIAGIPFSGSEAADLITEGAGVRNKLVGIRLVRNAK